MLGFLKSLFGGTPRSAETDFDIFKGGHEAAPNVLIFTEHVNATYFISFDIPLNELHARAEVNFAVASQNLVKKKGAGVWAQWHESFRPDVVVMTRYGLPYGKDILEYFKQRGVPVVYHIDDNLLEIPHSLGAEIQKVQGATQVIEERRHLLAHCDLIYASTPYLAGHLQKLYPTQKVFFGMYAPYMGARIEKAVFPVRESQVFGYMGSKGHQEDLQLVVPAITQLMEERPNLEFEVFGTIQMPGELLRFGDRVRSHKVNQAYSGFLSTLAALNWDVGLAPLVDEPFNLCKAPTKFVEYTAAGIPVVASDIAVYGKVIPDGGGLLVKDDWHRSIARMLDSQQARTSSLEIAKNYCETHFSEAVLQRQIQQVLAQARQAI